MAAWVALGVSATAQSQPADRMEACTHDAMLVFDGSGSMAKTGYTDRGKPRILDAREAMHRALPQIEPFRRMGLIVYGPGHKQACSNVELRLPPTSNAADPILAEIDTLQPEGNTPLTRSVELAAELLNYRKDPGVVVLVTDGSETCSGDPCQLADRLAAAATHFTVHVVGFRVRSTYLRWDQRYTEEPGTGASIARCLADRTGGLYLPTDTVDDLANALKKTLACPVITKLVEID